MKQLHIFTVFSTIETFFDGQFKYLVNRGDEIIIISSYSPKAESFARRNSVKFIPVVIPREISPYTILKAIKDIYIIIKKESPDVVFGHTPVGALCAMIAAKYAKVKKRIYYRHGVIYTTMKGLKYHIFRLEEKLVAALSTSIINVSHSLSKLADKDSLNPSYKNNVIGHGTCGGLDAHKIFNPELIKKDLLFEKKIQLGLANAQIIYGFCGRLCYDKGVSEMVDGFLLFQKMYPNINSKLLLIGALDKRDILPQQTIDLISNNKDIVLAGWVDKKELPYYYSMIDVFVFPSHREGFGMSVIEASAMEKPILVSRSHGCVDSIIEHRTGEYIDLNSESIFKGMVLMLDERLRNYLGKSGRLNVLACYDINVMWPLVYDLYQKLFKDNHEIGLKK